MTHFAEMKARGAVPARYVESHEWGPRGLSGRYGKAARALACACMFCGCSSSDPSENQVDTATTAGAQNTTSAVTNTSNAAVTSTGTVAGTTAGTSVTGTAVGTSTTGGDAGSVSGAGGASTGGFETTGTTTTSVGGSGMSGTTGAGGTSSTMGMTGAGGMSTTMGASGGAGGTSSGGSGGASGFQPCPTNGDACKILPLGDSITWGIQYDGAYRVELFARAVAANQNITFTGSLSNGPDMVSNVPFPKNNEGHSGWTIDQDAGLVPSPAFDTIPNIVLLMIGTNDVYAASGQSEMPTRLGALLDKIIAAAPDALLVVGKITPLSNSSWTATVDTYNAAIPDLVQQRVTEGKHVMLVDLNTDFTPSMLSSDGVHPNKSGYDFMGDVWYDAISSLLPM